MTELTSANQPGDQKEINPLGEKGGEVIKEEPAAAESVETLTFPEIIKKIDGLMQQLNEFAKTRTELLARAKQLESVQASDQLLSFIRRIPPAAGSNYITVLETFEKHIQLAKAIEVTEDQPEIAKELSEQLKAIDHLLQFITEDGAVRQLVEYVSFHETDSSRAMDSMIRLCIDFNKNVQKINGQIDQREGTPSGTEELVQNRNELIADFLAVFKQQLAEVQQHGLATDISSQDVEDAFAALRKSTLKGDAAKYINIFIRLRSIKQRMFGRLELATQTEENSVRAQIMKLADTQPNPGMAADCINDLQPYLTKTNVGDSDENTR